MAEKEPEEQGSWSRRASPSSSASSATWTKNGLPYDTAETTFLNRATLVDGPIYLDKVYVNKAVPEAVSDGMQCMEVRDTPSASNFLRVCGHAYVCGENVCWPQGVGAYVSVRGTLRHTSMSGAGGYYLSLNRTAGTPTPKVP